MIKVVASQTRWSKDERDANTVMTLPIDKRINNGLFIDRMAAIYIVDGQIKNVVRVVNDWCWLIRKSIIWYARMINQEAACFKMTNRNKREIAHYRYNIVK